MQLCSIENPQWYLQTENLFYSAYNYDHYTKTLVPLETGTIRVGIRHQVPVPERPLENPSTQDDRHLEDLETLIFSSSKCTLTDLQLDQLDLVGKSLNTFGRAVIGKPENSFGASLRFAAAASSRGVTTEWVLKMAHQAGYDYGATVAAFLNGRCPQITHDEIENFSLEEVGLFEEAMRKIGKKFIEIRDCYVRLKA